MSEVKIEKNIPLPPKRNGHDPRAKQMIEAMTLGDSIFLSDKKQRNHCVNVMRRCGYKATARAVEGGYRVWRIANKELEY